MKYAVFPILVALIASGCSSTPETTAEAETEVSQSQNGYDFVPMNVPLNNNPSFDAVYREWRGTPYRLGGSTRRGIDCSAFVQVGFANVMKVNLPRTTEEQVRRGKWVDISDLKKGDLVFFKTGRRLRHVGIYLGESRFLHASTSQGVTISNLNNPYWRSVYWQARRITTNGPYRTQ
ncbi:hypothetical protein ABT57_14945 [Photobacterium ganghwense]|uniref:NlpC/P60 domain-containing protein n=1 Tax=Photobacterium ganghwense TaxID=320778 RepID=A0A0J1H8V8_9GAMM|nr:NlpC/P60 family protein [Photobacterium ganghwense]KLV08114.1 hypothetical protein ABT57_14945 [Photobacterium ganghwense]